MLKQGRGHVINISSIYGNYPTAGAGVYGATKAAVVFLSESLRMESQGKIKVTTIRPTGVPTTGLGAGVINGGQSATVTFVLRVDAGTPVGTIISNQATVSTAELSAQLTDGDGNPSTGPEPTVVVVGATQQLSIAKSVTGQHMSGPAFFRLTRRNRS